ncbi:MAG: DHH family phosphoesterase [Oscillospiraceae bacterium]
MDFTEIQALLEQNDCFTILTHKGPDGDTLGSAFALCAVLRGMGKRANVVNNDPFPARYDPLYEGYTVEEFDERFVIAVDIADLQLLGSRMTKYAEPGAIDLCIDHHISNTGFAKQTYVDARASAAALILFELFRFMGRELTKRVATCLYTGIATDTGCFKYENTTPAAHIACAALMECGIDFAGINRRMFDVKSKGRVLLAAAGCAVNRIFLQRPLLDACDYQENDGRERHGARGV